MIAAIVHAHADQGTGRAATPRTGAHRRLSAAAAVLDAIRQADLFATIVPEDTYAVASEVHDLLVKTHVADREKIDEIKALVWEHLFIDRILEVATEVRASGLTGPILRRDVGRWRGPGPRPGAAAVCRDARSAADGAGTRRASPAGDEGRETADDDGDGGADRDQRQQLATDGRASRPRARSR